MVDETSDPVIQRIILKIVGFLDNLFLVGKGCVTFYFNYECKFKFLVAVGELRNLYNLPLLADL